MPENDLLNIDPDVLFQKHTISEIGDIQKKLLNEIERKKEELRIMVGEKYRDLIEAADTIGDMKITANDCIKHIEEMTVTCKNLHDAHLIGFKNDTLSSIVERPIVNKSINGIAVQIKLLMIIPEQIWSNVDIEDYLTATQLFLFARHIYTGLQLEIGNDNENKNVSNLLPIVHRQWSVLNNFSESLIHSCQSKLGDPELKAEVAASCLASLFLLNRNVNMVDLMNTFISLHSINRLNVILNKDIESSLTRGNIKDDIKDRIAICVLIIMGTIQLVYHCFAENDGLVLQKLNNLYKKDSSPIISLIKFQDELAKKCMPTVVSEFKLTSHIQLNAVSKTEISQCISHWMNWVQTFSAQKVDILLSYINSAKSLNSIREKALNIVNLETPSNWIDIYIALSVDHQHFDIWSAHFQPLITKRLKCIISNQWSDILTLFKSKLKEFLENIMKPTCIEKEVDLNWFIWSDLISKSCISYEDDIISSMNSLMKGMSMQDRGFTPNLEKICEVFDSSIHTLLEDLKIYLYEEVSTRNSIQLENLLMDSELKPTVPESKNIKDNNNISKYSDRIEIENHLKLSAMESVKSITKFIHEDCIKKSNDCIDDIYFKTSSIVTARMLQALPLLVPNLRICFIPISVQQNISNYEFSIVDTYTEWEEVCKILNDNCNKCWMNWIENATNRIDNLLSHLPQEFTMAANVKYMLVQWDAITIEEKDDQDQIVSSTIKIPSGPSIEVQQFLYSAGRILDEVIPHTLPRKIHLELINIIASKLIQYFLEVIKKKSNEINQKCALQLLMDIRHITLLLVTRENKKLLNDSNEICDILKEKIDPFDYNVFYPYLQTNVKRSVQRVQVLLGSLIPNNDQLTSIIGSKPLTSGGTSDRDPNAFVLASQNNTSVVWFPLLPVTIPISLNKKFNEKQRKKVIVPTNIALKSQEIATSATSSSMAASNTVRSSAAAFFGSMTSDWFGN